MAHDPDDLSIPSFGGAGAARNRSVRGRIGGMEDQATPGFDDRTDPSASADTHSPAPRPISAADPAHQQRNPADPELSIPRIGPAHSPYTKEAGRPIPQAPVRAEDLPRRVGPSTSPASPGTSAGRPALSNPTPPGAGTDDPTIGTDQQGATRSRRPSLRMVMGDGGIDRPIGPEPMPDQAAPRFDDLNGEDDTRRPYHPLIDPPEDDPADAFQPGRRRKGGLLRTVAVATIFTGILLAAGGAYWVWQSGTGPGGPPPLIQADNSPIRVEPENPGGLEVPFQDRLLLNESDEQVAAVPRVEGIVPPPEVPLDRNAPTPGSVTVPAPQDPGAASAPVPSVSIEPAAPVVVDRPQPPAAPLGARDDRNPQVFRADEDTASGPEALLPRVQPAPVVTAVPSVPGQSALASPLSPAGSSELALPLPLIRQTGLASSPTGSGVVPSISLEDAAAFGSPFGTGPAAAATQSSGSPAQTGQSTTVSDFGSTAIPGRNLGSLDLGLASDMRVTLAAPLDIPGDGRRVGVVYDVRPERSAPAQTQTAAQPARTVTSPTPTADSAAAAPTAPGSGSVLAQAPTTTETSGNAIPAAEIDRTSAQQPPATAAVAASPPATAQPQATPSGGFRSSGGGFSVQMAAVTNPDLVTSEWVRFVQTYPDLLSDLDVSTATVEVNGTNYWRILAGPLDRAGATAVCDQIKARGGDCILRN